MKKNHTGRLSRCMFYALAALFPVALNAQSSFFASSVFSHKMAFNPSQSGIDKNWRADMIFKSALDNSQPGLAKEFLVSADGPISESAGIGFNLLRQNTGILSQTLFHFNYAYGMEIRDNMNLRMGFSAGFKTNRLNINALALGNDVGDPSDPAFLAFNSAAPSFYSCFGLTFYTEQLELQLAAPNLTAKFQSNGAETIDYLMAQGALTYKMDMSGASWLGPNAYLKVLAGGMQYKQTGTIFQGGLQLAAYDFLKCNAMYSSSGTITGGLSIQVQKSINIDFNYTVGGLYSKSIYGGAGVSEVHLNYSFNKNKD